MSDTPAPRSGRRGLIGRLRRHPSAVVGGGVLLLIALASIACQFVSPYDPTQQQLTSVFQPPSSAHVLGTDQFGRDLLTRLLVGARYSLVLGFLAVALGLVLGVPLGAVSGYFGGLTDLLVQRFTDILLSLPGILLALALVAGLGVGLMNLVVAVGLSSMPVFIRLTRASVLSTRTLTHVEASRAVGASAPRILALHIMPLAFAPIIVQASLQLGTAILVAAGLGFLGLGVPPPTPEWGQMLGEFRNYIFSFPWLAPIPGVAISLTVLAFNLLGDGLRDVLDPRLHR